MTEKKKKILPPIANDCTLKEQNYFSKQEQDNIALITIDKCLKQLAPFLNEQERNDFLIDIICMIDGRARQRQYNAEELAKGKNIVC